MARPLGERRDTADRPESPVPSGFRRNGPICVVARLASSINYSLRGVDELDTRESPLQAAVCHLFDQGGDTGFGVPVACLEHADPRAPSAPHARVDQGTRARPLKLDHAARNARLLQKIAKVCRSLGIGLSVHDNQLDVRIRLKIDRGQ